ncbi:MAG: MBL fold metallo-hydrolase [Proteobacteria bacterium]|nr:MBL fold metallo-hydrolase [Pseudomonadota bacterium]
MNPRLWILAAIVLSLGGGAAWNTPAVQDGLLRLGFQRVLGPPPAAPEGLRVVVCGSASPLGNDPRRAQACIAVLTPEHLLVFDSGARAPLRMAQARLPLGRLTAVFLTHLHSDHIASLPDVLLAGWVQGRAAPLEVHGPEGIEEVVDGFNRAYRLDRSYRVAHHGSDLLPPAAGRMKAVSGTPGEVAWSDGRLTVRSFPVDHAPVSPALGYRVDYRGRSVVISGDTNASDDLFEAARGADLLLHDALSRALLDPMIEAAEARGIDRLSTVMTDVIDYHADVRSLEARAAQAGVARLVLYHLVPTPPNALAEKVFARGLSPETLLASDLQTFDLPPDSREIHIHAP